MSERLRPDFTGTVNPWRRRWVDILASRTKPALMGTKSLVILALASYGTSFLRERYLLQAALGSGSLDHAVLAYAIAALIANVYAITIGLVWIDGRHIPKLLMRFELFAVLGLLLILLWPLGGSCLLLASLISGSEFSRQRAAFLHRQS